MSSSSNRFEIFFSVGDIDRSSLYGQRQIMLTAKRISLESGKYISLKNCSRKCLMVVLSTIVIALFNAYFDYSSKLLSFDIKLSIME